MSRTKDWERAASDDDKLQVLSSDLKMAGDELDWVYKSL